MRRFLLCLVAAALLALGASACSSTLNDAATIKYSLSGKDHEEHVTRADLISEVRKIAADKPFATWLNQNGFPINGDVTTGSNVSAVWLGRLILQKAIDALFDSRHLTVTSAVRTSAAANMPRIFPTPDAYDAFPAKFRAELLDREARREALLSSFVDTSDAAGRRYFEQHQSQFACASGRDVSHILVASRAAAEQILAQLRSGADFAELAKEKSTDTGSGAQGGALGCLMPNGFVAPFQAAAEAAPFDTPVGPVQSQYGYHVILVTHATPSYEASRTQVQQALAAQGQAAAQAALTKMLTSFKVKVDPRFGTWVVKGPQGQTFFVSPPTPAEPNSSRDATTTTTTASAANGTP
jgi:parvulin-like peptidyl-prolyl cis-trans isomerase-like protein